MEELLDRLKKSIDETLYQIILSNPIKKEGVLKVKVRPVMVKKQLCFQKSSYIGSKVLHQNMDKEELIEDIKELTTKEFRQLEIETREEKVVVLVSKKGKMTIKTTKNKEVREVKELSHNRVKEYILSEGTTVPFLIDLGVQTPEGKIIHSKYDKFRQLNRYLEFVQDILPILPKDRQVSIIDFGCGKSYLTFALYYYLCELMKIDVHITGLDLKEDVIQKCNMLRDKYGYHNLEFIKGDISKFEGAKEVDMVVTLHACDTATDYALQKAVCWNAKVILSVPCCQHEVQKQIKNTLLEPILKYGILKERISALLTDGIRANLLEEVGYETQILEFIDMEHTPKNILIRAIKRTDQKYKKEDLSKLLSELNIQVTLQKLLEDNL